MALNVLNSDEACKACLKHYAKKHSFKTGDKFDISCKGIPLEYTSPAFIAVSKDLSPELVLDPVKWAAEVLDWHCLDPDGSVWARKDPEEYTRVMAEHPDRVSKYHRPGQAIMLRCSARYKVFRIGRQYGKTETLVVSMLFHMFTNTGFKIVLITPFQSQIDLIFKRLEDLLRSSGVLANSIKRSVKAPQYTIELHNGSQVKGFTAGTKSGQGAAAARGQSANMLVFDEADYLDKADLDAAMAIITNYPDATVWMSSTPSGKREKFYELCSDREWKEYHFSSHANPNWSTQLDNLFKKNLTSLGYKREILAEFGEQEEGVFQVGFVEQALADYEYSHMYPQANWLYTIGVDWNSPAVGTTIYVMGFNIATNKFMPVEHHTVQREGWTQHAACQKIIELNRRWKPFSIYIDKGFGSVQNEILHKYGYDARVDPERGPNHIDAKLVKVVKAFEFGSTVDIRDPFTKEIRKKPAKGFLVENTVRRFESGDILIPREDTYLKRELLGYIIKNVSITGQVSYTSMDESIGDHNLDALMLSLVAFTLEKSEFGKPTLSERIEFTAIDNMPGPSITANVSAKLTKEEVKPNLSRSEIKQDKQKGKLWSWPGFGSDKPKPTTPNKEKSNIMFQRPGKPGRRNSF